MRPPYELQIALRYLLYHRGRAFFSIIAFISVLGVAVGTAALVIALSLMTGFEEDVRERILGGGAHLTVMSAVHNQFEGAGEVARDIERLPGMVAAGPVLYTPAMLSAADRSSPVYGEVFGVDPQAHARVTRPGEGETPFAPLLRPTSSRRAGIVLGRQLASRLLAGPGDLVQVIVPSLSMSPLGPVPRSRMFEVVGTYSSDNFQEDAQRAYVALPAARRLLRSPNMASWVEVRLDDVNKLDERRTELSTSLGTDWIVIDLIAENQDFIKALNTEKLALFLAIGLIVVVAALNIISTLILIVTDKVKEIGTLSALGARPTGIALVFVLQGLFIGVVGTVSGLVLGASVAYWLDSAQLIRLNPEVYYLSFVPFTVVASDLVSIGVVALLISLVATIYPAWKAARLDPVEALRHE